MCDGTCIKDCPMEAPTCVVKAIKEAIAKITAAVEFSSAVAKVPAPTMKKGGYFSISPINSTAQIESFLVGQVDDGEHTTHRIICVQRASLLKDNCRRDGRRPIQNSAIIVKNRRNQKCALSYSGMSSSIEDQAIELLAARETDLLTKRQADALAQKSKNRIYFLVDAGLQLNETPN